MMTPEPIVRDNIEIGRFTYFPDDFEFKTWAPGEKVVIGSFCSIGNYVFICTGGNHRSDIASTWPFDNFFLGRPKPNRCYQGTRDTTIGNDVWLGRRSTIMAGAHVGHGAVVAANSVVFSDIPPYAIVAGNPATVVRYRFSRAAIERMLRIAWWDWPEAKLRAEVEWFYRPINEFVERFDGAASPTTGASDDTTAHPAAPAAGAISNLSGLKLHSSGRNAHDVHAPHAGGPHRPVAAPIENSVSDPTRHTAS